MMMMHKALYSRENIDRLYLKRNVGGRGLTSIEDHVHEAVHGLDKKEQILITMPQNCNNNKNNIRFIKSKI